MSLILAPIAHVGLNSLGALGGGDSEADKLFAAMGHTVAPWAVLALVTTSIGSAFRAARVRKQFEAQASLDTLRTLHWKEFEVLTAELFRRKGFEVTEKLGGGADGGLDLKLRKGNQGAVVQCKRWKSKIKLGTARELYGTMMSEGVSTGYDKRRLSHWLSSQSG